MGHNAVEIPMMCDFPDEGSWGILDAIEPMKEVLSGLFLFPTLRPLDSSLYNQRFLLAN
jgi:hypothetical protein